MRLPAFSERGFRREIRASDEADYGIDFSLPIEPVLRQAVVALDEPDRLKSFNDFPLGKKRGISYNDYSTVLVLRALATYLRNKFGLSIDSREAIIRSVIQALSDNAPIRVLKRDISSFYENVPTSALREELLFGTVLPAKARRWLDEFLQIHCSTGVGVPRGLGLSATLAELSMRDADQAIKAIDGVHQYHRFADDIMVFCTGDVKNTSEKIRRALPRPMTLNLSKAKSISLLPSVYGKDQYAKLDYLGYEFRVLVRPEKKHEARTVHVGIAKSKTNRIKTRLILSARAFFIDKDFDIFYLRVTYLAGNIKFLKAVALESTNQQVVRTGIHYNYKYSGSYTDGRYSAPLVPELKLIDWFYQNTILGNRGKIGSAILGILTPPQLTSLRKLSFAQGHLKVFHASIDADQMKLIKKVWMNV